MIKPINPVKRDWLKELRKEMKLTAREAAELIGCSFQHYSHIENGHRNPSVELSIVMAEFYDVPLEKFLQERSSFINTGGENDGRKENSKVQ